MKKVRDAVRRRAGTSPVPPTQTFSSRPAATSAIIESSITADDAECSDGPMERRVNGLNYRLRWMVLLGDAVHVDVRSTLVPVFRSWTGALGTSVAVLRCAIEHDFVTNLSNPGSILRGVSVASKLLASYTHEMGREYLKAAVQPTVLSVVMDISEDWEVELSRIQVDTEGLEMVSPEVLDRLRRDKLRLNRLTLESKLTELVSRLSQPHYMALLPPGIRALARTIQALALQYCPEQAQRLVGGYFFLRFVNAALLAPESLKFMLPPGVDPTAQHRRKLVILCKVIQNLSNDVHFPESSDWGVLNGWLDRHAEPVAALLQGITQPLEGDTDADAYASQSLRYGDRSQSVDFEPPPCSCPAQRCCYTQLAHTTPSTSLAVLGQALRSVEPIMVSSLATCFSDPSNMRLFSRYCNAKLPKGLVATAHPRIRQSLSSDQLPGAAFDAPGTGTSTAVFGTYRRRTSVTELPALVLTSQRAGALPKPVAPTEACSSPTPAHHRHVGVQSPPRVQVSPPSSTTTTTTSSSSSRHSSRTTRLSRGSASSSSSSSSSSPTTRRPPVYPSFIRPHATSTGGSSGGGGGGGGCGGGGASPSTAAPPPLPPKPAKSGSQRVPEKASSNTWVRSVSTSTLPGRRGRSPSPPASGSSSRSPRRGKQSGWTLDLLMDSLRVWRPGLLLTPTSLAEAEEAQHASPQDKRVDAVRQILMRRLRILGTLLRGVAPLLSSRLHQGSAVAVGELCATLSFDKLVADGLLGPDQLAQGADKPVPLSVDAWKLLVMIVQAMANEEVGVWMDASLGLDRFWASDAAGWALHFLRLPSLAHAKCLLRCAMEKDLIVNSRHSDKSVLRDVTLEVDRFSFNRAKMERMKDFITAKASSSS